MILGYEEVNWRKRDEVIKFCEANRLYLDNYKSIANVDSQLRIIDIKLSYCNALIDKHHYKECFDSLEHLNIMINKLKDHPRIKNSSVYESYLFAEALVYGYLKRYEESQKNFKELIKIDPQNDLYKDWVKSNKTKIIAKKSNIVGYIGCGLIFLSIFLDLFYRLKYSNYINIFGVIIMILGFTFPFIATKLTKFD